MRILELGSQIRNMNWDHLTGTYEPGPRWRNSQTAILKQLINGLILSKSLSEKYRGNFTLVCIKIPNF